MCRKAIAGVMKRTAIVKSQGDDMKTFLMDVDKTQGNNSPT